MIHKKKFQFIFYFILIYISRLFIIILYYILFNNIKFLFPKVESK
jgi:hypothetical protein